MMNVQRSCGVIVYKNLLKEIEGFICLKYGEMRNILTFENSKQALMAAKDFNSNK